LRAAPSPSGFAKRGNLEQFREVTSRYRRRGDRPHAPQFLTLPETEDHAQVARVNAAMRELGESFRALDPDLVIVISNAHCDDFVVRCVPAFAIHCGARAAGSGVHAGWWPIDGEAGGAL